MSTSPIDIEDLIVNPLESGPVRASFTAKDEEYTLPEFDNLQDAVFAFHHFGRRHGLADPDGAFGTVFLSEEEDDTQEIMMRFDSMGTVFLEA